MALKNSISASAYDGLSDELKKHYTKDDDGKNYTLDVTGGEDTGALKRANERLKTERDELRAELNEADEKLAEAEKKKTREDRDVERLTTKHQREVAALNEDHAAKLKGRDDFIRETLVDATARQIAGKISTVPDIMTDHLTKRMDVDFTGEKPKLVIKDKEGKPSALTPEKLGEEMVANPGLKAIIIASKAQGSGADKKPNVPALGGAGNEQREQVNPGRLTPRELAQRIKDKKAGQDGGAAA